MLATAQRQVASQDPSSRRGGSQEASSPQVPLLQVASTAQASATSLEGGWLGFARGIYNTR